MSEIKGVHCFEDKRASMLAITPSTSDRCRKPDDPPRWSTLGLGCTASLARSRCPSLGLAVPLLLDATRCRSSANALDALRNRGRC